MAGSIAAERPRTARGTATKARIVEAAADLMRAHGVASTSVDAVLAASKASKSQLYHYFADKDDLVLAVIQRQTECVLAAQELMLRGLTDLAGLRRWRTQLWSCLGKASARVVARLDRWSQSWPRFPKPRAQLAESFARWEAYLIADFKAMRDRSGTSRVST